jgi:hypothetical protein
MLRTIYNGATRDVVVLHNYIAISPVAIYFSVVMIEVIIYGVIYDDIMM